MSGSGGGGHTSDRSGPGDRESEGGGAGARRPVTSQERGSDMPPWVPRAILTLIGSLVATALAWWLVVRLGNLILLIVVSLFLSFALEPGVNRLEDRGWRRGPATGFLLLVATLVSIAFMAIIGRVVIDQVDTFVDKAPGYLDQIESWAESTFEVELDVEELAAEFADGGAASELATRLADDLIAIGSRLISLAFEALTVALFTFYLVADGPRLRRSVCSLLPPQRQREVLRVWELAIEKTGGYIYSRALLAAFSAAAHGLVLFLLGVPFPLALAIWIGVTSQFIPVVGTYLAGVLPVLIAVLEQPSTGLWVLIFIVAYQQFENYVLLPSITAQTMDLHPAVAFGAVIAGAGLIGPIGAVLALPASATLQAFVSSYLSRHELISSQLIDPRPRRVIRSRRLARFVGRREPPDPS